MKTSADIIAEATAQSEREPYSNSQLTASVILLTRICTEQQDMISELGSDILEVKTVVLALMNANDLKLIED